jgi:hypothetical protein
MIHNGILFGGTFGFSELPTSRGWPLPSADDRCSPFLDDESLFPSVRPYESSSLPVDAEVYFDGQCLTDLSVLVPYSSSMLTSPWLEDSVVSFVPSQCTGFLNKEPAFMFGLHRVIEAYANDALELADAYTNAAAVAKRTASMEKLYLGSREMRQGILMSMLFYMARTDEATNFATLVVGVMFGVVAFMLLFQYLFLGSRVEKLLRDNAFIAMNIQALLEALAANKDAAKGVPHEDHSDDSS